MPDLLESLVKQQSGSSDVRSTLSQRLQEKNILLDNPTAQLTAHQAFRKYVWEAGAAVGPGDHQIGVSVDNHRCVQASNSATNGWMCALLLVLEELCCTARGRLQRSMMC